MFHWLNSTLVNSLSSVFHIILLVTIIAADTEKGQVLIQYVQFMCECVPKNIMVPVSLFWSSHTYTYSRSAEAKFILLRCLVDIWSEQHLVWVELVFPEESSYICVSQPSILILIPSKSVFLTQPQDKFWSKWFTYFYSWVLWETKWHLGCKCLFYYNASSNLFWPSSNTATKAIFVVSLLGDPSIWI